MKVTPTPTSSAADLPEALRSIQRFEVVDCIDDKHVPAVIPKPHGPWVRYEDHIAALAAGQATAAPAQPAAQQGAAYAALPEPDIAVGNDGRARIYTRKDIVGGPYYTAGQLRDFADATHALRASHGQAPAGAARADSVQEDAAREPLQIFDSPRAKALMRAFEEGWAACRDAEFVGEDAQNDAFNQSATVNVCLAEDWTAAAERAARAPADSVQEDAAFWRWLAEYLVGPRTDLDDELVACETVDDMRKLAKAAMGSRTTA